MQITESIEVRWFLAPDPARDAALHAWFDDATVEGQRVDTYLHTGSAGVGFKLRRAAGHTARVETKYLTHALGAIEITPTITGYLERWQKLSLELDDPNLQDEGSWIALKKDRRLRKFAFDGGHAFEIGPTERLRAGAGLELTTLHFEHADRTLTATTLGIEAFGVSADLRSIFEHTARRAFADAPALTLRPADSLSYPAWLELLTVRSGN